MGINKNSNGYTFTFATLMVVVVGAALSLAAMGLKPFQKENVKREKMQSILASVQVTTSRDNAEENFNQYIVDQVALNNKGEVTEGVQAFDVDVRKQYKKVLGNAYKESWKVEKSLKVTSNLEPKAA